MPVRHCCGKYMYFSAMKGIPAGRVGAAIAHKALWNAAAVCTQWVFFKILFKSIVVGVASCNRLH